MKALRDSSLPECELRMMMMRIYQNQINNNEQTNKQASEIRKANERKSEQTGEKNPSTLV